MKRFILVAILLTTLATPATAQTTATYTWNSGATTNLWLDPANWIDGNSGRFPGATGAGLATQGTANDTAVIKNVTTGASNGIAIDFGVAGGSLAVGAIHFDRPVSEGLAIGNSSTTTAGVLRLNGATVEGIANVIVANTNESFGPSFIWETPTSPSGGPGMTLQLGTSNGVFYLPSGSLWIDVPITEAAAGSGFTLIGGELALQRVNTFTGAVQAMNGFLTIGLDANLGAAPGSPTANHLVLRDSWLNTVLSFELNANRGIAIGPTSGSGVGTGTVAVAEGKVLTYNGIIANTTTGSGQLEKRDPGILILGGTNTFDGGTMLRYGELRLTNVLALGSTGTVTISPQGTTSSGIHVPAALQVLAEGTFSRPIVVNAGNTAPVAIGTPNFSASAATVFSGGVTLNRAVALQGGNSVGTFFTAPFAGTGDITITAAGVGTKVVFNHSGATANSFGNLTLAPGATLQLGTGTSNFQNRMIPDTSNVTLIAGSRLNLMPEGTDGEAINALDGASGTFVERVLGGGVFTLTVGTANGTGAFHGIIQQADAGRILRLVKAGTGTQTLRGANTYNGGTIVNGGTLLVTNTTGSGTGISDVTVNAGGTLGGTGFVAPPLAPNVVPVSVNGGTIQAGGTDTAAPTRNDVLRITQQLIFDGASTLRTTVGQSGGTAKAGLIDMHDAGVFAGQLARNTAGETTDVLTIRLTNDGTLDLSGNSSYTVNVLEYFSIGGLTEFTDQANPAHFAAAAENFSFLNSPLINLNGGHLSVTFTPVPVPEPATVLALAFTALGTGWVVRRRGRRPSSGIALCYTDAIER